MAKTNNQTPVKGATLNGNMILGVGLLHATRKGFGENEQLGDVIAVKLGKERENGSVKYSFMPLAEVLAKSTNIAEQLDKWTRVYGDRRTALEQAKGFADAYGLDLLPKEAGEWNALPAKEAGEKKAKKSAAERAREALAKCSEGERWTLAVEILEALHGKQGLQQAEKLEGIAKVIRLACEATANNTNK